MVRGMMLIGLVFSLALNTFADSASFKKTKLEIIEKNKQKFIDVELRIEDQKIVVVEKKRSSVRVEIPYSQIKNINYEMARRRRISEGAAVAVLSLGAGAVLMLTKTKSHWLTIEHEKGTELKETAFRLHKDEYGPVIAVLEEKSGKPVTILANVEHPAAGSKNMEEIVPYLVDQVRTALKRSMEKYSCRVTKEEDDKIECKRGRGNYEAPQGGGGEKVTAKLKIDDSSTRVKIKTGKGFVGRFGKKNWSTPIFKEMMRILEEKTDQTADVRPPDRR